MYLVPTLSVGDQKPNMKNSTSFHCDECPRKFGIQFKLQSHKLIVHSKKNCEICGQQAYSAFELTRHKADAHGIVPKDVYLCDTFPLFFKHPRNLAKHKETSTIKTYL
jgi:hypothetical protein